MQIRNKGFVCFSSMHSTDRPQAELSCPLHLAVPGSHLQVVLRACRFPIVFFIICIVLLAVVKLNSCSSYIEAWLTLLPMMVVMTVVSLVAAYIFEPKVSFHCMATA